MRWVRWAERVVAVAGILVVAWAAVTAWGAVVHGHPAYAIALVVTVLACIGALADSFRRGRRRIVLPALGIGLGAVVIAVVAWLRPFPAGEASVAALQPDDEVAVTETATAIVLEPTGERRDVAVLYQPGARVDPRAYAALLRGLAEAGYPVVIAKQPLGIAFLALGALDEARAAVPEATGWVIAGHSLGGTVAAIIADDADEAAVAPAVGLLLHASYPASDLSGTLTAAAASVSASNDGLSTPEKIDQSRALLPAGTEFTVIEGAVHAQFGDYGAQPGDGVPTIDDAAARELILAASLAFLESLR